MGLGISSYTFPWAFGVQGYPQPKTPLNAVRLLEKAESLGVNVVQICDNFPLHMMEDKTLNDLSKIARDMGITIEVGTRGIEPENLLTYLNIAKKLNAKLLRTVFEVPSEKPSLNKIMAQIKPVLPLFEKERVYIALENYEQFKSRELALLVRRLSSSYVGVCLDTVNSFGALEGLEEVVNRLAAFTINLHLKDFDIVRVKHRMGFKVVGRPLGEGKLNVDRLFKVLKRKGRTPNVIVELWVPFLGSIEKTILKEEEWAIRSIEYLKRRMLE
ncbi:MAG: sugar phosphate isomerase/epimerase family protein [Candidatus Bathyarchaeia archaeon]